MTFLRERKGFQQFRTGFVNIERDFIQALRKLHLRYDTAIRENRFVVGGATEIVLGAAMRACGVPRTSSWNPNGDFGFVVRGWGRGLFGQVHVAFQQHTFGQCSGKNRCG